MTARRRSLPYLLTMLASVPFSVGGVAQLPATAPTQGSASNTVAPLSGTPSTTGHAGAQAAQVSCAGGQLEVHAQNSSLNQILRSISRCTGMRITGHVADQRVFGDYGPAAPATVLATLLDGTGTNMLLQETVADQPAELILTARTGGPTPPPVSTNSDDEAEGESPASAPPQNPYQQAGQRPMMGRGLPPGMQGSGPGGNQTPVPQPYPGSPVTSPPSIPQPTNNINGSASNTSPTASSYPTTNSVPLDAIATPSTTPATNGIVDAPNPPPAGSDTAALLNGAPQGTPGTTNISPNSTAPTTTPGATNTTAPATNTTPDANSSTQLTPEQIFQQLQERVRQQEQQQQTDTNPQ